MTPVATGRPVGARTDDLRELRRLGLAGSLLLAVGAFGAGALPMPNPMAGLRLVGLPARNPTISLAVAYAGLVLLLLAWGRVLRSYAASPRSGATPRHPTGRCRS